MAWNKVLDGTFFFIFLLILIFPLFFFFYRGPEVQYKLSTAIIREVS
jgi:hypothetical protein